MTKPVKYLIGIFLLILFSGAVYYIVRKSQDSPAKKYTAYIKGEENQQYKPGKETITVKERTVHKQVIKKPLKDKTVSPDSSTIPFFFTDSTGYRLLINVTTYPGVDSVKLDFDLSYKEICRTRIDTIYKIRIDTLKIQSEVEKPRPFYDNFWFGAAAVSVLVAGVVILTK